MAGQFYLAVLVARLVSLHVAPLVKTGKIVKPDKIPTFASSRTTGTLDKGKDALFAPCA